MLTFNVTARKISQATQPTSQKQTVSHCRHRPDSLGAVCFTRSLHAGSFIFLTNRLSFQAKSQTKRPAVSTDFCSKNLPASHHIHPFAIHNRKRRRSQSRMPRLTCDFAGGCWLKTCFTWTATNRSISLSATEKTALRGSFFRPLSLCINATSIWYGVCLSGRYRSRCILSRRDGYIAIPVKYFSPV